MSFTSNVTLATSSTTSTPLTSPGESSESRKRALPPSETARCEQALKRVKKEWEAILTAPRGPLADKARLIEQTAGHLKTSSKISRLIDSSPLSIPKDAILTEALVRQLDLQSKYDFSLIKLWEAMRDISDNPIELPEFTKAEEIRNWFKTADESLITQYTHIDLPRKRIELLPPEIGKLTSLKAINLHHNSLTSLPPEIGQLKRLKELQLQNNSITALPPEIGKLTNLQYLYLDYNSLTNLPLEFGKLTSLKALNFNYNSLTSLPPEIGKLTSLEELQLDHNSLTSLPNEICGLANLEQLSLEYNCLRALPDNISDLQKLTSLYLSRNPLLKIDNLSDEFKNLKVFKRSEYEIAGISLR